MLTMVPWEIAVTVAILLVILLFRWIPGLPGYKPEPELRPTSTDAHSDSEGQHPGH